MGLDTDDAMEKLTGPCVDGDNSDEAIPVSDGGMVTTPSADDEISAKMELGDDVCI